MLSATLEIRKNQIPQLVRDLPKAAEFGLDHFAANVIQQAGSNAPVLTGALRSSRFRITPLHDDFDTAVGAMHANNPKAGAVERPDVSKLEAVFGFAADYAKWVHDGHHTLSGSFVAGQPFLADAMNASGGAAELARIIGDELKGSLERT